MTGEGGREREDIPAEGMGPDAKHETRRSARSSEDESPPDHEAETAAVDEVVQEEETQDEDEENEDLLSLDPLTDPALVTPSSASVDSEPQKLSQDVQPSVSEDSDRWTLESPSCQIASSKDEIRKQISPSGRVRRSFMRLERPNLSLERNKDSIASKCKPSEKHETLLTISRPERLKLTQEYEFIMPDYESDSNQSQTHQHFIDELYEFELWDGNSGSGSPFSRRRPQVVIHEQHGDNSESFEFLCRYLRDLYSLIEDGEPTVQPVEFVSNQPRIPSLSNRILSLNMTDDAWEIDSEPETVQARRHNTDIVPKLRAISRTQFSGSLGFLVINVPTGTKVSLYETESAADKLHRELTRALQEEEITQTIVKVSPREEHSDSAWAEIMGEYLGFEGFDQADSVARIEDQYWDIVHNPDWHAVALTEQQSETDSISQDGESDHHYLTKAAIANAIGQYSYRAMSSSSEYETYSAFFDDLVSTFVKTEDDLKDGYEADIVIEASDDEVPVADAMDTFCELDDDWQSYKRLAFEFETGRCQAAFSFRKIRHTLEKFDSADVGFVGIVVPPWVLRIDQDQSNSIPQFVSQWNRTHDETEIKLLTPRFSLDGSVQLASSEVSTDG